MARGLNKVMIIGTVGRDPEMRRTPSGTPVTSFSVAVGRAWMTPDGVRKEATEWFNVVAWRELAESCAEKLAKSRRVYVEGSLQTRTWDDQFGQRHQRVELVADQVILLDRAPRDEWAQPQADEEFLGSNKVMIIGNLGRKPDFRYTPNGTAVTTFSVAVGRAWTTPDGERKEATEWFNVVAWRELAEICDRMLDKGRRVYIEGALQTRSWEDYNGQRHFRVEVVADQMIVLERPQREERPLHLFEEEWDSEH